MTTYQPLERRLDPPSLSVHLPPWAFCLVDDELVDISWYGIRLLSGVRVVVRDHDWRTVPTRVGSVTFVEFENEVELKAVIDASGFGIECSIDLHVGVSAEAMKVEFTGTSRVPFRSNRIGLVVLHPRELQGERVVVKHTSGDSTESAFPTSISPHQPFLDIAALSWAIEGVEARIEFDGDVFETEDQRNWTDASFKTYSRPLEMPFPFHVEQGETVSQSILISAKGDTPVAPVTWRGGPAVIGEETSSRIPAITTAIGAGDGGQGFSDVVLAEVDLTRPDWRRDLDRMVEVSRAHEAQLDLRLVVDEPKDGHKAADVLSDVSLVRLAMFDKRSHMTEAGNFETMSAFRDRIGHPVDLLVGTRAHFTELNRSHLRLADVLRAADGVTFSITPQMHATELRHIVSSIEAQQDVVRSVADIVHEKPVHIGPITLESRFNAVATSSSEANSRPPVDPLTKSSFAAAWIVASVAALARDGVASLSYFRIGDVVGAPAASLLQELALLRGQPIVALLTGARRDVAILPVSTDRGNVMFFGNLSRELRRIDVMCQAAVRHEVAIEAWSLERVDCGHR